ncbi:MAG: HXXEE domain-containing protein [Pseudomonadota bacterium]
MAPLALVTAFALLWVPFGQHAFLIPHWMKVGVFMAPFFLLTAAACRRPEDGPWLRDLRTLTALMLACYILHQAEEHWVDLTGETYAFHGYVNAVLQGAVGAPDTQEILTREAIFVINTSLVWFVGALGILLSPPRVFPALCMAAIILVNAVSHIGAAIGSGVYNPGLATSFVPFIPLALWTFSVAWTHGGGGPVLASVIWAVFAHIVMIGGVLGAMWAELYPESAYFAMLIATAALPALLYRRSIIPH